MPCWRGRRSMSRRHFFPRPVSRTRLWWMTKALNSPDRCGRTTAELESRVTSVWTNGTRAMPTYWRGCGRPRDRTPSRSSQTAKQVSQPVVPQNETIKIRTARWLPAYVLATASLDRKSVETASDLAYEPRHAEPTRVIDPTDRFPWLTDVTLSRSHGELVA